MNKWLVLWRTTIFLIILAVGLPRIAAAEIPWEQTKGKHFIIYYQNAKSERWAKRVLRKAERYYERIADNIGYARYKNFWTWDDRVKIFVFPDQGSFMKYTGAPAWSIGGAIRDRHSLNKRQIITFRQESGFLDGVLPHEISHLMIRDFIGVDKTIPMWFDEGVAQLQEEQKVRQANGYMRSLVQRDMYLPLNTLNTYDVRSEVNPHAVALFYAQSVSIVNFLIKKHGVQKFSNLCSLMREGKPFHKALSQAYTNSISDLNDLEKKWLRYMKN